jgi:hypothetical protein
MAIAAVFPRHRHAAIARHRQRRPALFVDRLRRLDRLHRLHGERVTPQRQRGDDDALEAARLLGPGCIHGVAAAAQRHLRRSGLRQLQRRAAGQHPRLYRAGLFPRRHEAAAAQRQHHRLIAFVLAQLDFRLELRRRRRLQCQIALRAAAAVVFPHHADGVARDGNALAVGRLDMRENRCALHRVDRQRRAPFPRGVRRPRQHRQQQRGRPHDLLPRNSSRVFCL